MTITARPLQNQGGDYTGDIQVLANNGSGEFKMLKTLYDGDVNQGTFTQFVLTLSPNGVRQLYGQLDTALQLIAANADPS